MSRLIVVSNRVTLPDDNKSAGGLAVALQEALRKQGGIWCGWSGLTREYPKRHHAEQGNVQYVTTDITKMDYEDFYVGYCNSTLWPLFHYRMGLTKFRHAMQDGYERVNEQFAEMTADLAAPDDLIWVHDYQMIRTGHHLRAMGVDNRIGFFLHIPFPGPEIFSALPNAMEMLEGFAAYDMVGFQTQSDLESFLRCMKDIAGGMTLSKIGTEQVIVEAFGRKFTAGTFPISIDTDAMSAMAADSTSTSYIAQLKRSLNGQKMLIGVDRLDYSKGLVRRMEAYEHFLRENQDRAEEFTYMQITPTSRADVEEYAKLKEEVDGIVAHINGTYGRMGWVPLHYLNRSYSRETLAGYYRMSRACLVTPLRDGMNLVAKEYVACQNIADPGVLILSQFAGAAQEMEGALIVNPFDIEATGNAIRQALTMPLEERCDRHQQMMRMLKKNDIFAWTDSFMKQLQTTPLQARTLATRHRKRSPLRTEDPYGIEHLRTAV